MFEACLSDDVFVLVGHALAYLGIGDGVAVDRFNNHVGKPVVEAFAQFVTLLLRPIGESVPEVFVHEFASVAHPIIDKRVYQPISQEMMHPQRQLTQYVEPDMLHRSGVTLPLRYRIRSLHHTGTQHPE